VIPLCRPSWGPPRSLACCRGWTLYVGTTRQRSTIGARYPGAASRPASSRLLRMEPSGNGSPVPRRGGPAAIGYGRYTSVRQTCPPLASRQTRRSSGGAGGAAAPMRPCATSCRPALWSTTPASGATTPWPRRSPSNVGRKGGRSWRSPTYGIKTALYTNRTLWFSAPPTTPSSAMSRSPGRTDQARPGYGKREVYDNAKFLDAAGRRWPGVAFEFLPLIVGARGVWPACNLPTSRALGIHPGLRRACVASVLKWGCSAHRDFMRRVWKNSATVRFRTGNRHQP
jgi:hypothetical protein